ncbi:hypothetical protein [Paraburkholderia gardini]|uniref:hypothetical protein n=1 Tax=Paraburkholderia gardini TaxID=2823469 RepID=UPI001E5B922C|nr:hypothetical protein [Paraburkholderia gardini]
MSAFDHGSSAQFIFMFILTFGRNGFIVRRGASFCFNSLCFVSPDSISGDFHDTHALPGSGTRTTKGIDTRPSSPDAWTGIAGVLDSA